MIINILGAPSAGKSTLAHSLFVECKKQGKDVGMCLDVGRDIILRGGNLIKLQPYVFGQQLKRLATACKNYDLVITDGSILLNALYCEGWPESLKDCIINTFDMYEKEGLNKNYLLKLDKPSQKDSGRIHSFEESKEIEDELIRILKFYYFPYKEITKEDGEQIIWKDLNEKI